MLLTPGGNKHVHVLRGTGEGAAESEEGDGSQHDGTPTEGVRKMAGEREEGGTGERIRGADP